MPDDPIVEPNAIHDVFCTEIVQIKSVGGGMSRITIAAPRGRTREIVDKLVIPDDRIAAWALQLAAYARNRR